MDLTSLLGHLLNNGAIVTVCLRPENPPLAPTENQIVNETKTDELEEAEENLNHWEELECIKSDIQNDVPDNDPPNKESSKKSKPEKVYKKKTKIHRIRHSPEEYHCTTCTYTCTTEKAFIRHQRVCQTGEIIKEPSVSCPICGKDRNNQNCLELHMKKHKKDRHFCCDMCAFKTVQLKKLIQHRRMHTGEKPHLCPFCYYRSSRRDNLRSHVRRVHKESELPCETFVPRNIVLKPSKSAVDESN